MVDPDLRPQGSSFKLWRRRRRWNVYCSFRALRSHRLAGLPPGRKRMIADDIETQMQPNRPTGFFVFEIPRQVQASFGIAPRVFRRKHTSVEQLGELIDQRPVSQVIGRFVAEHYWFGTCSGRRFFFS